MKFISVRDFRNRSAQIWKELSASKEMVITNNGRPIAILSAVGESDLEDALSAFRRARAAEALVQLQSRSLAQGTDKISPDEINAEIASVRRSGKR